jgi:hypothetical protein
MTYLTRPMRFTCEEGSFFSNSEKLTARLDGSARGSADGRRTHTIRLSRIPSSRLESKNFFWELQLHILQPRVRTDVLEERDRVSRSGALCRREHAMGGCSCEALGGGVKGLADVDDEGVLEGRDVDPLPRQVLNLQTSVVRCLQKLWVQSTISSGRPARNLRK